MMRPNQFRSKQLMDDEISIPSTNLRFGAAPASTGVCWRPRPSTVQPPSAWQSCASCTRPALLWDDERDEADYDEMSYAHFDTVDAYDYLD